MRRRVFAAIWAQGLHLSSAYEVRQLVTAVMWPQEDITGRLASPEILSLLIRDPDLARTVRRSPARSRRTASPLTATGLAADEAVGQQWLELPSRISPPS